MERYRNLSGKSNVISFEIADDSIHVVFRSGRHRNYLYTNTRPGKQTVDQMKELAMAGRGLNSYIGRVVKDRYARKW